LRFLDFFFNFFFLDYVSHSGHAHMMTISDLFMISKWENLRKSRVFKYLFSSLQVIWMTTQFAYQTLQ